MRQHLDALRTASDAITAAFRSGARPRPLDATAVLVAHAFLTCAARARPADDAITVRLRDVAAQLDLLRKMPVVAPIERYELLTRWAST